MSKQDETHEQNASNRPVDPFKSLGNETRLEILRVLYDRTRGSNARDATVSYSTLREAVGVRDKGNFNYHLRQLDGQFLERGTTATGTRTGDESADEDGYRLTFAGFEIAKVIDMDAWRSHDPRGPVVLEDCDDDDRAGSRRTEPLKAVYEDSVVELRRSETTLYAHAVRPTGAADRGMRMDALLDVTSTLWRGTIERILEGICPYCHARVDRSLEPDGSGYWRHSFTASCPECGPLGGSHVGVVLLVHPAAISFCWERGIDLTERRFWTLPFIDDDAVTVVSEEPRRLRLDVELEGDRLEAVVDDAVTVVEVDRYDADR
ncbi:ArsR family transcriptional regulator [Natrarchaeobius sp. A-rgal3]|uniref:DUF7351 domain-containing protein n=1 Tax=Natrarchaeobius versutus TaxID=1679078 RepID=UPI00350FC22C